MFKRITIGIAFLAVTLALSVGVVSLCAEICHSRYSQYGDDGVASFPCRDDHELAYFHALRWLLHCEGRGCKTWIIKDTRLASFVTPPQLYAWSRTVCFGIAASNRNKALAGWKQTAYLDVVFYAREPECQAFEHCILGSLRNVLRIKSRGDFKFGNRHILCQRRNVLDFFRFPFRFADGITVRVASDNEEPPT